MNKSTVLAILAVFAITTGIILVALLKNSSEPDLSLIKILPSDHVKGQREAKVSLIEYSDFQCPACGAYYPVVKELEKSYGEKVAFVYRHFPLSQIHANARLAAQAAEAAGKQDKFWQIHDLLFEKQAEWSDLKNAREKFAEYAKSLNLDVAKFLSEIDSKEIADRIDSDYQGGLSGKVNATPTFFLNGQKIQNPSSLENFKNVLDEAINSNK